VCILSQDQAEWRERAAECPHGTVLVRPVTMKQLLETLAGLQRA
jgi:hypothetical protein